MTEPQPAVSKRRRLPDEGEVAVFVADEQHDHVVDATRWGRLAEDVLHAEGIQGDAELSVLFLDEESMAELNKRFMDEDGPTDVLAFPLEDDVEAGRWPDGSSSGPPFRSEPTEAPMLLGDVVICPAVAARNAGSRAAVPGAGPAPVDAALEPAMGPVTHGGTYEDEVALLVVHGILHVLGMDHAEKEQAAAMQARERDLLERFYR